MPLALEGDDKGFAGNYLRTFANSIARGAHEAWRLQYLTDLKTLPDFDEGYGGYSRGQGAPVDDDGVPVFSSRLEDLE